MGTTTNSNLENKVIQKIKKSKVKWIRLQFCDPFGMLHQLSVPADEITKQAFSLGFPLDGSSIRGFTTINESDILLVPEAKTFCIVPEYFDNYSADSQPQYPTKAARMFVKIDEGLNKGRFKRDSRFIAQKAESFAKKNGFSNTFWAAEIEFFVFDKFSSNVAEKSKQPKIISKEAPWNPQTDEDTIFLKRGYYRDSPADKLTNLRDEISETLADLGVKVIAHHHEVATAGQSEIILSHQGLLKMGDNFVTGVKTVREVAAKRGMVASFNPKPIPNDNGSAVHVNQSLWKIKNKKEYNAFYDPAEKYAELSQLALYYIGGLLDHSKALCAITNPTKESYNRLVPGYEAPTNIAWGRMNRSVSVRVPAHHKKLPAQKRIEYRPPDPSSNIYLVETALLLVGLDGVKKKIQPGDPVDVNTYKLSPSEMKKHGVKKLPTSLVEAKNAIKSDNKFLKPILDNDFMQMYLENLR